MSIPSHSVSVDFVIPFHHCDPLGVVWHGRYFEYFEVTRAALMRSVQLDVEDIRTMGYKMFVVDSRCRWMRALNYGDSALCTAWFAPDGPHIRIAFDLRTMDRMRCARAVMVFALTTVDGVLLTQVPSPVLEKLPYES